MEFEVDPISRTLSNKKEESDMPKTKPPSSPGLRQQMVEPVHSGRKPSELSKEFGCHTISILSWVRQRSRNPAKLAGPPHCATTGIRRRALPLMSPRSTAGSPRLTLSYSAASDTASPSCWRAAACSDGLMPSVTSVMSSTMLENISSRGYWRWRCASNTSFVQCASACSRASLAACRTGA